MLPIAVGRALPPALKRSGSNPQGGLARNAVRRYATRDLEETSEMDQTTRHPMTTPGGPLGRLALAAFAVGGLSAALAGVDSAGAATKAAAKTVVVSTDKTAKSGTVLVSGKTLYTVKPSMTACTASCLKVWPALVLPAGQTKATAESGVTASKLGTVARSGGVRQVTYGGKALYFFAGDSKAGQVNGDVSDEWGKWSAVVTKKGSSSGSSTATTAGSGGTAF
jgi:predicted lipoprotein with Yx(FWY)xxD motif